MTRLLGRMFLAWLFVSWALPDAYGAVDPVDIGVYADQQPTWRRRVAGSQVALPFVSPYDEQEGSGDPITRARLRIVAGVGSPLDTYPADVVAWAKYVFIGNYDDEENGVFQTLNDQRLGVFDTETNTFCEIVVDSEANTSVYRLGVGDPTSRQTRIYFGGFHNMNGVEGSQFGYIEASLDTPNALNPCDPQTGWPVTNLDVTKSQAAKRRSRRSKRSATAGAGPTSSVARPCGCTRTPARWRQSARSV